MSAYARYIGIDYSGAETPTASLKGLRVFMAVGDALPVERRGTAATVATQILDTARHRRMAG